MPVIVAKPLTQAEHLELRQRLAEAMDSDGRAAALLSRFILAEVVNDALDSLSLDEVLHRLVALACDVVNAERATIFLFDADRDELYSRIQGGDDTGEIRIPRGSGIAGAVFDSGTPAIVGDAYADPRFNPTVDQHTGYRTGSVLCVPMRQQDGAVAGVFELLNKRDAAFDQIDHVLLECIAAQAARTLAHAQAFDALLREHRQDQKLLEMTEAMTIELELDQLLRKIVDASATLLGGERATLFMHDPARRELYSRVTVGGQVDELRFADDIGIAGATLKTGLTINVREARSDPRFNSAIDQQTGYMTRSLISTPVLGQAGAPIAVLQVLNARTGWFARLDEQRLRSFARQVAITLQNAQLFSDVLALKSYTEGLLRSLPDGVVSFDAEGNLLGLNAAAAHLLACDPERVPAEPTTSLWRRNNPWLVEALAYVARTGRMDHRPDVEFALPGGGAANVNATIAPVKAPGGAPSGISLILQDISRQKKVHSTFGRYIAREFVERALSGKPSSETVCATVLFSDIRRFTAISEALSPQDTVSMLNEYFGEMAGAVQRHDGVLDKYIGDAIMAVFGAVNSDPADPDHAVAAALEMISRLRELNLRRQTRGAQPLEIGIGLASGEIAAGPIGSADRVNYTVIGDSVNLASRLESANKQYGTSILLAASTAERLTNPVRIRTVDLVRVKGKEKPTEVFELLDAYPPQSRTALDKALSSFEEGVKRYRARAWTRALEQFAAVLRIAPNDGPSWVYTDRCLYYRDHPPPAHWDGVWAMKTK